MEEDPFEWKAAAKRRRRKEVLQCKFLDLQFSSFSLFAEKEVFITISGGV